MFSAWRPAFIAVIVSTVVAAWHWPRLAAAQLGPQATIVLYGDSINWRGDSGQEVGVELFRDGLGIGNGAGRTGTSGAVAIRIEGSAGANVISIAPGDEIQVFAGTDYTETISIPSLHATVTDAGASVAVTAPTGVSVALKRIINGTWFRTEFLGEVEINESGTGEIRLPLAEPNLQGLAEIKMDGRHTFRVAFARPRVYVDVSSGRIEGQATYGTQVALELRNRLGQVTSVNTAVPETRNSMDWLATSDGAFALGAGTQITATHTDAHGTRSVSTSEAPQISITVDDRSGALAGVGPPKSDLHLVLRDGDGVAITRTVRTDADGAYRASLPGIDTSQGVAADITYDTGGVFVFRALYVIDSISIGLYSTDVLGFVGLADVPVRVEVRSPEGDVKAEGSVRTNDHGRYRFSMWVSTDPRVEQDLLLLPGDIVTIDLTDGDAKNVVVPDIRVTVDVENERLSGQALPSSVVWAGIGESDTVDTSHHTVADPIGQFELTFGDRELRRPISGILEVRTANRVRFTMGWAAPEVTIELHSGEIRGLGPRGLPLSARLVDSDGKVVGGKEFSMRARNHEPVGHWVTNLRDWAGEISRATSGDVLQLDVASERIAIAIPWLHSEVNVETDEVHGQLNPQSKATLTIGRKNEGGRFVQRTSVTVEGDAQGRFARDFSGVYDIRLNDEIRLEYEDPAGHRILHYRSVPGVVIDIDRSAVHGYSEPGASIVVDRGDDHWAGQASASGQYFIELGAGLRGSMLSVGDRVTVRRQLTDGSDTILASVKIPEFTLLVDEDRGAVRGAAPHPGEVDLHVVHTFRRTIGGGTSTFGFRRATVAESGQYEVQLDRIGVLGSTVSTEPGQRFRAILSLDNGVQLVRWKLFPIANAQQRGARVCGYGQPRTEVSARVVGGPAEGASGNALVARDFSYEIELQHASGEPATLGNGSRLEVSFPGGTETMTIPRFDLDTAWNYQSAQRNVPSTRISGWVGIGTMLYLKMPASGCLRGNTDAFSLELTRSEWFDYAEAPRVNPGNGLLLGHFLGTGHRQFHLKIRPRLQVFVRSNRISGDVSPGIRTTLRLVDPSGREVATAEETGDTFGRFDAVLTDRVGLAEATLQPGMKIGVQFGAVREEIIIDDISFDYSPETGVVVVAAANRPVRVEFDTLDGRTHKVAGTTNADGRWLISPQELPARAGWTLADVALIRAVAWNLAGHEFIAETEIRGPRGEIRVYLPMALYR